MSSRPGPRPVEAPVTIRYSGADFDLRASETVLDALLRHGVEAPYSCRKGTCFSCMARAVTGDLPPGSQDGLRDSLCDQGYFLACRCAPSSDLVIAAPDDAALYGRAAVTDIDRLSDDIARVRLVTAMPLYYHAGQFINLRRPDGLVRSYSLASVPTLDQFLEIHVKRLPGGQMSEWVHGALQPGDALDIQGPNGGCYYLPGEPDRPLLLIGTGSGLAPLIGIARDALNDGHRGPVYLYHGSRTADGLYLRDTLDELSARIENFHYHSCLSGESAAGCRAGRADVVALADHSNLQGFRVYLCGLPPMVHSARKAAFLAGAALPDIYADPFELCEPVG